MALVAAVAEVAFPPTRTHSGELNVRRPAGLRWQPSCSGWLTGSGPASAAAGLVSSSAAATSAMRISIHSGEGVPERVEHHVRARLLELLARVVPGGDAERHAAGAVRRVEVLGGVADHERPLRVDRMAQEHLAALERLLRELDPVRRVRAVAAEREVAVEAGARELDVRGGLDGARRDPEQDPVVAREPFEQVLGAVEHAVLLRVLDLVREAVQIGGHHGGYFARRRVVPDGCLERAPGDGRIGHAGVGERADVGGDPVELVEGVAPAARAGAAGGDERPVDVEENGLGLVHWELRAYPAFARPARQYASRCAR